MPTPSRFYGLGIAPNILKILDKHNFTDPTPIQEKSIPIAIEGTDLIGIAQTGTGKTLAFGIPLVQAALSHKRGLIVLPTRELALQVYENLGKIGAPLGVQMALLIGGEPIYRQIRALGKKPQVVIGTPGRIIDHVQQKTFSLATISTVVLDEADRMLDMGFAPQLKKILDGIPSQRQTMLFSATMPKEIFSIAEKSMKLPTHLEIAPQGTPASQITQELFFLNKDDKPKLLQQILSEYRGSVLIFVRMKHSARKIALHVRSLGYTASELHSNRSLGQRKEAMSGFRNGTYRILVATDIAARGIDVKGIELVINYDLPDSPSDYVHRIGRTGRTGNVGHAISFATPDQQGDVKTIEALIRKALPRASRPGVVEEPRPRSTLASSAPRRRPQTRPFRRWDKRGGR